MTGFYLQKANKIANQTLVKIVAGDLTSDDDRIEKAARLIAHLAGRGGNDIGFKTWGAAPLLAKKLIQQKLIPDMASRSVLELGTGTGLVGLACDKLGAAELIMTDYHQSVLSNVTTNVALNESNARILELDFIKVAKDEAPEWKGRTFDVVIASDLLYEMEHAQYLPIAVDKLMENEFHFMIPLRPTHTNEVNVFEETMKKLGLHPQRVTETKKVEEEGLVRYRYYLYTRS
ncbi:putative methyltransferase-domain-containing protein [Dichotomocladium elegans]|nr:putative methyltransferase-domain-containing protein [Dichotomocladium elegans]